MSLASYQPGSKSIFYYAAETGTYPAGNAVPTASSPAIPTGAVWGGWTDSPSVSIDEGSKNIYGIGSDEPQTIIPGGRVVSVNVSQRVSNLGLLQKCLKGSGGYRGIADLCLFTGLSNIDSDGFTRVVRFAKSNTVGFTFAKGSAQELIAQTQFMGLTEYASATGLTPTNTDFAAYGAPLTWHNLLEVNIGSVNLRDITDQISFSINHNLEAKNFRPDFGPDNPWSRTAYALMPRQRAYTVSMRFEDPDARAYVLGLARSALNSHTETGAFSLVTSNEGSSTEGDYTNGFTLAASAGRIKGSGTAGGDPANELMSSVDLLVTGVTLTPLAP